MNGAVVTSTNEQIFVQVQNLQEELDFFQIESTHQYIFVLTSM